MLLDLEMYRSKKLVHLSKALANNDCEALYKIKKVWEAQSILEINQIMEFSTNRNSEGELELFLARSKELADMTNTSGLEYESIRHLIFSGLLGDMRERLKLSVETLTPFSPNYLKILENSFKKNGHCPCKIPYPDTYCPCVESSQEIEKDGHCHCRMFIK